MRGAYDVIAASTYTFRITPAHAGSILLPGDGKIMVQDHPRACGEHCNSFGLPEKFAGSPPRMRGAWAHNVPYLAAKRITPAHAGSIRISVLGHLGFWDHPRACGEHLLSTGRLFS